jgi:hypothetical protein
MARRLILGFMVALACTSAGFAEPISGKAAKKALLSPKGAEAQLQASAGLPKDQAKVLSQVAADQPFYGAIAISPDEGLMSEATFAAVNYHSLDAAAAAAIAECNTKKKAASPAACVVAALITPKGWKAGGFQLSRDATLAFRDSYAKTAGALATSDLTGAFGLAEGAGAPEAAIAACAAKSPQAVDCKVVIAE